MIDIDVMPPGIEGLTTDEFAFIGERVCCKLAPVSLLTILGRFHVECSAISGFSKNNAILNHIL